MPKLFYEGIRETIIIPDSILKIIEKICDNNAFLDLERAEILEKLSQDYKLNQIKKKQYFEQTLSIIKEVSKQCFYDGYIDDVDSIITPSQIEDFINVLRKNVQFKLEIKHVFNLFLTQEQISIEALAVLFYLSEVEVNFLKEITSIDQTNEDLVFYTTLVELLTPYVLPDKFLLTGYLNCTKLYLCMSIKETEQVAFVPVKSNVFDNCMSKIKLTTMNILKLLEENKDKIPFDCHLKSLITITNKFSNYICEYHKDINLAQKTGLNKVDLQNYKNWGFKFCYLIQSWYKALCAELISINKKLKELNKGTKITQQIQQEAAALIEFLKDITKSKKHHTKDYTFASKSITVISPETLDTDYQFSVSLDDLKARVKSLNKKHLLFFNSIFNFNKNQNLKFSDLEFAIKALGGKIKIHGGSKTWIYMPGGTLAGGFHKPHQDNIPLNFAQVYLIAKGLERSGITKELIKANLKDLEETQNPQRGSNTNFSSSKGRRINI